MALIKPTIYADLVREKFEGRSRFLPLATQVGLLQGNVGDTVSFPMWENISDATDVTKGTAVGTEELSQTESTATIKMVAPKGVTVYDIDDMTALGNAIQEGASQQGVVIGRKLDDDLADEAKKTDLQVATAGALAITTAELDKGFAEFGDNQDAEDMAGIIIHSSVLAGLLSDDRFTSVDKTFTADGSGIVRNGLVGFYRGVPVFMSDKGTYDATAKEAITFIIKKGALGYMPKGGVHSEEKREAEYFRSTIFSNYVYAVKLLNAEGVVMLRKTLPTP